MDKEAQRWQHLRNDAVLLEKAIVKRLHLDRESRDVATGRGLYDKPSIYQTVTDKYLAPINY